jgi:hypothetical protein
MSRIGDWNFDVLGKQKAEAERASAFLFMGFSLLGF